MRWSNAALAAAVALMSIVAVTRLTGGGPDPHAVSAAPHETREPGFRAVHGVGPSARIGPPPPEPVHPRKPKVIVVLGTLVVMAVIAYRRVGGGES